MMEWGDGFSGKYGKCWKSWWIGLCRIKVWRARFSVSIIGYRGMLRMGMESRSELVSGFAACRFNGDYSRFKISGGE